MTSPAIVREALARRIAFTVDAETRYRGMENEPWIIEARARREADYMAGEYDCGPEYRAAYAALAALDATPGEGAESCQRCGHDNPSWSAPSPLWNAVMRGGCIDGEALFSDMVCAACFMALAEGVASGFRVTADVVNVPLQTVTPSGRVWDDATGLWADASPVKLDDQPAAWRGENRIHSGYWGARVTLDRPDESDGQWRNVEPLYARPLPAAPLSGSVVK